MIKPKTYYVTTAIDYVNAPPHLGHAYEKIAADVVARFQRLLGKSVYFLTGTDEHGTKVAKTAAEKGVDPKTYTDRMSDQFKSAWHDLNIRYNRFIRTTDPDHYAVVAMLWRRMQAKNDIYKARYTARYCSGCEAFLTERDLTPQDECVIHRRTPETIEEENYFFRLSLYKEALRDLIQQGDFVKPDFRAQDVLNMLDELQDISVSRPTHSVSWGIPVPDDPDQTIYVWIDALSNYVTGVGYGHDETLFNRYWPADCHLIGKDILRFHAIYWPAMLMSADVDVPRSVFAHGFINLNDSKISKSIGNVISPQDLMRRFELTGPDPIRYYLMTVTTFGQDGNFTEEDFKTKVNADLANNLGNLVNRTLNMTQKYFEGYVPSLPHVDNQALYQPDSAYLAQLTEMFDQLPEGSDEKKQWKDGYRFPSSSVSTVSLDTPRFLIPSLREHPYYLNSTAFDRFVDDICFKYACFDFEFAMFTLFQQLINPVNTFIDEQAPWALWKAGETDKLAYVLYSALERIRQVTILLYPVTPDFSKNILQQLGYAVSSTTDETALVLDGDRLLQWSSLYEPLPFGQAIRLTGPLLPRLEDEILGAAAKKK